MSCGSSSQKRSLEPIAPPAMAVGDYGPAERSGERIGKAAAECEVNDGGDDVRERLEEEVRMEKCGGPRCT